MEEKEIISKSYIGDMNTEWKTSQNTVKGSSALNHKQQMSQHSFLTKTISKAEEYMKYLEMLEHKKAGKIAGVNLSGGGE